jgi:hypothetical protein
MSSTPEVIQLLEKYLDAAKKMRFGHVSVAMVGAPDVAAVGYAGEILMEKAAVEALDHVKKMIQDSIDNWELPEQDKELGKDYVVYNVAHAPLGFDFLVWILTQEMIRVKEGAPAPLKIGFYCGKDVTKTMGAEKRMLWLENVFKPILPLLGAVEDPKALYGWRDETYITKVLVKRAEEGEQLPFLRSPHPSMYDTPYITVTLREASHWPTRNSDLEAWTKFANDIKAQGERVIFVRDTEKAHEPIDGFEINSQASLSIQRRMQCYQHAKMNLFVANGPAMLATMSEVPWMLFLPIENEDSGYAPNTPKFLRDNMGLDAGIGQYPWARPVDQKIIWGKDSYQNISRAWREFMAVQAYKAA